MCYGQIKLTFLEVSIVHVIGKHHGVIKGGGEQRYTLPSPSPSPPPNLYMSMNAVQADVLCSNKINIPEVSVTTEEHQRQGHNYWWHGDGAKFLLSDALPTPPNLYMSVDAVQAYMLGSNKLNIPGSECDNWRTSQARA